jgi:3-hydroxymyristoyl/3-hydroxydecanoyl-(acyl carrier protein) dehydratase
MLLQLNISVDSEKKNEKTICKKKKVKNNRLHLPNFFQKYMGMVVVVLMDGMMMGVLGVVLMTIFYAQKKINFIRLTDYRFLNPPL